MRLTRTPYASTVVAAVTLALASVVATSRSATLVVSQSGASPFSTIQAAVNAAVPGQDDVFVSCGTYVENVAMRDGVPVRGENPRCAILRGIGGTSGPAVTFPPLTTATEVRGLTLRADAMQPAVYGEGGPLVVTGNVIEASRQGVLVTAVAAPATPVITRNVIRDNAEGGIRIEAWNPSSAPTISGNLVVGSGIGVEVLVDEAPLTVTNNTVARNAGGGISIYSASGVGAVTIVNNVVAWNGGLGGLAFYGPQPPEIRTNDVWSNTPVDYDVSTGSPAASNFSQDPLFADEVRDFAGYEPRAGSPLVDRAEAAWAPTRDLRNVPRVSGRGCWNVADVGARENEGVTRVRWVNRTDLRWDSLGTPCLSYLEHQVLRGDLGVLRSTGVYRQDPAQVPSATRWCELLFDLSDSTVPEPGQTFFYLVNGWSYCETPLGFTSGAQLRPGGICWNLCPVGTE